MDKKGIKKWIKNVTGSKSISESCKFILRLPNGWFIRENFTNEPFSRMNHPVLDASPYIDAIFGGRFIRSCQPETILLLGLGTNEPQVNQPILWGVRGAESNISNPPKLGQKLRKNVSICMRFFRSPLAVHE